MKKVCFLFSCFLDEVCMSKDGCCCFCLLFLFLYQNQLICVVYYRSLIIQQQGCSFLEFVCLVYCWGNCGDSFFMYLFEGNMVEYRCQCCQELWILLRNVILYCIDGFSWVFSYIEVEECGCMGWCCFVLGDIQYLEEVEFEFSQEVESGSWERGVLVFFMY